MDMPITLYAVVCVHPYHGPEAEGPYNYKLATERRYALQQLKTDCEVYVVPLRYYTEQ